MRSSGAKLALTLTVLAALLAVAPAVSAAAKPPKPVDLDVLFIGAHPDDEAFGLAAYGAWAEELGARIGVVTVTRGEGGGNAVGSGGRPVARPACARPRSGARSPGPASATSTTWTRSTSTTPSPRR